jgi:prepilin-type N-terminal cleavage/methylation domain-containing protein
MKKEDLKYSQNKNGFTLIETLVGTAIFVIIAMSVYQAYTVSMAVIRASRVKITATALANEQFEIMRNLPYTDVGTIEGGPTGKIPQIQNLIRDNKEFTINTSIISIDDFFDNKAPTDSSPIDYKLVEIEITCSNCINFLPIKMTSYIAP